MTNDTCTWPKCYHRPWKSRGFPICGEHARFIAYAMGQSDAVRPLQELVYELRSKVVHLTSELERQKQPPKAKKPVPQDGVIYYLRVGSYIKIGWASVLTKRMKAYPPDSVLMATEPGTRKDESALHRKFAVHRTHGREWYALVPPIMEHIARVQTKHGEPDSVAFAAKPVTVPRRYSSQPLGKRGLGPRHVA
jgi:hypothetical protein